MALSSAITSSLKVSVHSGTNGTVGFLNYGYNGFPVNKDAYSTSFYINGKYSGSVSISLRGTSGAIFDRRNIEVNSTASDFLYYTTDMVANFSPDANNWWQLKFDAEQAAGSSLWFDLVMLYPSTYHSR